MRSCRALCALVCAVVSLQVLSFAPAHAARSVRPSEWVIGPHKHVVMLTIDGQTGRRHMLSVVRKLQRKGAAASFFIAGKWVARHRRTSRHIDRAGFTLGNRGYGTGRLTGKSYRRVARSIHKAKEALNRVGASPRPFLRFPKGSRDLHALRSAGSLGYRSVRWSQHPGGGSVRTVAHRVLHHLRPGSIVSLDVWRPSNRHAIGRIIRGIRARGFSLESIEPLANVHAVRWDESLSQGSSGLGVSYLQKALKAVTFPAGRSDGAFGYATRQGVTAFEKYSSRARDAIVSPAEMERIATMQRPRKPHRHGKHFVDVDISRQVLFEVRRGKVRHTLPVSSGGEYYYSSGGHTYKAHTPRGSYVIERKIAGWRTSRLGRLYYPSYFTGGFAIHGEPEVPSYPASHGCVRIPMYVARSFFYRNRIGTPVYVHD